MFHDLRDSVICSLFRVGYFEDYGLITHGVFLQIVPWVSNCHVLVVVSKRLDPSLTSFSVIVT